MAQVAQALSRQVNRVVLDRTRLTGQFDLNLEWTPGPGEFRPPVPADGPGTGDPSPVSGPSIFTALQEQLGLKLNSAKGPVNVLVVDRAERPTAN
jgi:bla regulator protein blaR1